MAAPFVDLAGSRADAGLDARVRVRDADAAAAGYSRDVDWGSPARRPGRTAALTPVGVVVEAGRAGQRVPGRVSGPHGGPRVGVRTGLRATAAQPVRRRDADQGVSARPRPSAGRSWRWGSPARGAGLDPATLAGFFTFGSAGSLAALGYAGELLPRAAVVGRGVRPVPRRRLRAGRARLSGGSTRAAADRDAVIVVAAGVDRRCGLPWGERRVATLFHRRQPRRTRPATKYSTIAPTTSSTAAMAAAATRVLDREPDEDHGPVLGEAGADVGHRLRVRS